MPAAALLAGLADVVASGSRVRELDLPGGMQGRKSGSRSGTPIRAPGKAGRAGQLLRSVLPRARPQTGGTPGRNACRSRHRLRSSGRPPSWPGRGFCKVMLAGEVPVFLALGHACALSFGPGFEATARTGPPTARGRAWAGIRDGGSQTAQPDLVVPRGVREGHVGVALAQSLGATQPDRSRTRARGRRCSMSGRVAACWVGQAARAGLGGRGVTGRGLPGAQSPRCSRCWLARSRAAVPVDFSCLWVLSPGWVTWLRAGPHLAGGRRRAGPRAWSGRSLCWLSPVVRAARPSGRDGGVVAGLCGSGRPPNHRPELRLPGCSRDRTHPARREGVALAVAERMPGGLDCAAGSGLRSLVKSIVAWGYRRSK